MHILDALSDPKVFGQHFRGNTWAAWRVFLAALFALPLTDEQLKLFQQFTGRSTPPRSPFQEAWLCIGRRGGKSFVLACIAVYLACFKDWRPYLGPGEVATVMLIARDRRQARVIKRFITGLLKSTPMLAKTIEGETAESITLRNRVSIEIHTASFRSTRGYTIVAALLDEIAFWEIDEHSAEPDIEVINALRPGMATIPGAMLLCASSPHARKGALWSAYTKHFGKDNAPVLVWQAATRDMNASVPQSYIDQHVLEDPARAAAEYGAQFRSDLEAFVSREVLEACIGDYFELLPALASTSYFAFCDPSGGSGGDSFTLAISHRDDERVVIDCVREIRPPFSPENAIEELVAVLKLYGVYTVTGDRFGGGFPREQFERRNVAYECSEKIKSDIYRELLPLLNSGHITIPRHTRLVTQLLGLERTVARGSGRESIDHARDGHDDISNAVAGAALLAGTDTYDTSARWMSGSWSEDAATPAERQAAADAQSAADAQWRCDQYFMRMLGPHNYFHNR